jgi:hypothetical protein
MWEASTLPHSPTPALCCFLCCHLSDFYTSSLLDKCSLAVEVWLSSLCCYMPHITSCQWDSMCGYCIFNGADVFIVLKVIHYSLHFPHADSFIVRLGYMTYFSQWMNEDITVIQRETLNEISSVLCFHLSQWDKHTLGGYTFILSFAIWIKVKET